MLQELLKDTKAYPQILEYELARLKECKKDIYIFGGILDGMSLGAEVRRFLDKNGIEIKGYIANKSFIKTSFYLGKPIYSLEDSNLAKDIAIVIGMVGVKEKSNELKSYGYHNLYFFNIFREMLGFRKFKSYFLANEEKFDETYNLLADNLSRKVMLGYLKDRVYNNYSSLVATQDKRGYFNDLIKFKDGEIMIDCGAYDGDSVLEFIRHCPNYSKVYAFEPDNDNFKKLQHNVSKHNVCCINKGVYSRDDILRFNESGDNGGGHFSIDGQIEIPVCMIDSIVDGGGCNIYQDGYRRCRTRSFKRCKRNYKKV